MNLQRVSTGTAARVMLSCCKCGQRFRDKELYADLDGAAFNAFYCEPCAESVAPEHIAAYRAYANQTGYWDALCKRIEAGE